LVIIISVTLLKIVNIALFGASTMHSVVNPDPEIFRDIVHLPDD
jgi:hypothetical protein